MIYLFRAWPFIFRPKVPQGESAKYTAWNEQPEVWYRLVRSMHRKIPKRFRCDIEWAHCPLPINPLHPERPAWHYGVIGWTYKPGRMLFKTMSEYKSLYRHSRVHIGAAKSEQQTGFVHIGEYERKPVPKDFQFGSYVVPNKEGEKDER